MKKVKGIGLLHDVMAAKHELKPLTLILGDNGSGKSTLASILRSLGEGNGARIAERTTLGQNHSPYAHLQVSPTNAGDNHVSFRSGSWDKPFENLHVFDSTFVEEAVYSGSSIEPRHRSRLLEFAIGEEAVAASEAATEAARRSAAASKRIRELEAELIGPHTGTVLEDFKVLEPVEFPDEKRAEFDARLADARRATRILQRRRPAKIQAPAIDITGIVSTLKAARETIRDEAARELVATHINTLNDTGGEAWIRRGRALAHRDGCPYCGQDTSEVDLVQAYAEYYNEAYDVHQRAIEQLPQQVASVAGDDRATRLISAFENERNAEGVWREDLGGDAVEVPADEIREAFMAFRTLLESLVEQKQELPEVSIPDASIREAEDAASQVRQLVLSLNTAIGQSKDEIDSYAGELSQSDPSAIEQEILNLGLRRSRYTTPVVGLLNELAEEEKRKTAAEKNTTEKREAFRSLTDSILDRYVNNMNAILAKFGAAFSVSPIQSDFRGKEPKSNYAIVVRGSEIRPRGGDVSPTFATALSEGDKRTLAFAFFLARVTDESRLSDKIVVIDDPISSMDSARRRASVQEIAKVCDRASQVIVLCHDPYFLRDIERSCRNTESKSLKFVTDANGFSTLDSVRLDEVCRDAYVKAYFAVAEFTYDFVGNSDLIAKSVRTLLEGYLRRRFPGRFPHGMTMGEMLKMIRTADSGSPLRAAIDVVEEIDSINDFARDFHHDSDDPHAGPNAAALRAYCVRALDCVHGSRSDE